MSPGLDLYYQRRTSTGAGAVCGVLGWHSDPAETRPTSLAQMLECFLSTGIVPELDPTRQELFPALFTLPNKLGLFPCLPLTPGAPKQIPYFIGSHTKKATEGHQRFQCPIRQLVSPRRWWSPWQHILPNRLHVICIMALCHPMDVGKPPGIKRTDVSYSLAKAKLFQLGWWFYSKEVT